MADKTQAPRSFPGENECTVFLKGIPRIPEQDVEQWGQVTTAGILAGMMYGGAREATATHNEFLEKFQKTTTRFTHRELMEQRLIRIVRGTVRGGVQLGLVGGIFSAAQIIIAALVRDGKQDMWSTAGAGAFTGAAMGLVGRGNARTRIQSSVGLALTGAAIALPLGLLQDSLRALMPEPELPAPGPMPQVDASLEVAAAIERLESRLLRDTNGESEGSRTDQKS